MQSRPGYWFRALSLASPILLLLASLQATVAAEVSLVLAAPTVPVDAGKPATFWLNALNTDQAPARFAFPGRIETQLQGGGRTATTALEAAEAGASAVVNVAPGGFARREYRLDVPSWAGGTVILEAVGVTAGKVAFEVTPQGPGRESANVPGAVAAPTTTGEAGEKKPAAHPNGSRAFQYFKDHIYPYEPFYFIAGFEAPNAKFQISFKYQLVNQDGDAAMYVPGLTNLFVGFTQTSLWDLSAPSAPFFDSSYKPELLYAWRDVRWGRSWPEWFRMDLESGLQHESNGKAGADSRSLNILYLRPRFVFGSQDGFQFSLAPKAWVYVGDLDNNPDLPFYRGYVELRAIAGWERNVQLSASARVGNTFERGSLSLDASYPLRALPFHTFTGYLYVQYFTGYGESLLRYNEWSDSIRFGFALTR